MWTYVRNDLGYEILIYSLDAWCSIWRELGEIWRFCLQVIKHGLGSSFGSGAKHGIHISGEWYLLMLSFAIDIPSSRFAQSISALRGRDTVKHVLPTYLLRSFSNSIKSEDVLADIKAPFFSDGFITRSSKVGDHCLRQFFMAWYSSTFMCPCIIWWLVLCSWNAAWAVQNSAWFLNVCLISVTLTSPNLICFASSDSKVLSSVRKACCKQAGYRNVESDKNKSHDFSAVVIRSKALSCSGVRVTSIHVLAYHVNIKPAKKRIMDEVIVPPLSVLIT